ncbi:nitroreductase family protein [Paenibacillus timonensis]|uniref:Putative NAD(P)H nitroreductase n=1 Tax=Paenibacillus timonensis TaxID=225915 RepID=A0ABW3S708_9BACL|nr:MULTISPECIES: nitroreductase family protein [Paenibacillus]MCH1638945.1 nitroreductase family protein [Paenibacillus timonensis]MDU2242556.1 nitroreductase family protein [Paenibacillus sp.]
MSDELSRVIRERRTVRRYSQKEITDELILELLDDAVWAPYHSAREPWRFILFKEEGRRTFARAVLQTYTREELEQYGESAERDYCDNAVAHLIVVAKEEPRPREAEEALLACAALIQNFQLLAWSRGIGVVWKTNEYNWDPRFRKVVGVRPGEKVVGTLHMGYYPLDKLPKPRPRRRAEHLISWHKS